MLCSLLGVALLATFISVLPSEPPMIAGWAGGVTGVAVMIVVVFDIGVAVTPEVGATAIVQDFVAQCILDGFEQCVFQVNCFSSEFAADGSQFGFRFV